jgi:hypothetical protein
MSALIIGLWIASVLLIVWALRSIAVAVRRVADVLYQTANPGAVLPDRPLDPPDRLESNSFR